MDFKNCKQIKVWLSEQTKQPIIDIHKTDNNLYILWGNPPHQSKIKLTAGVLYCLHEEDFNSIIKEMNDEYCYLKVS